MSTPDGAVLVNSEGPYAPVCNAQTEPSVAAYGDTLVAGWIDDRQCSAALAGEAPFSLSAFGRSTDGGRTWEERGLIELPGGEVRGDPVLAAGPDGTFFYATRAAVTIEAPGGLETDQSIIGVARSFDGGKTFGAPVNASGPAGEGVDQDKPWLTVDNVAGSPYAGSVYVGWTQFQIELVPPLETPNYERTVYLARSLDGGATYLPPQPLSVPVEGDDGGMEEHPGIGVQLAVGPGGEVYAVWTDYVLREAPSQDRPFTVSVWFTRSLDGGETFDPPRKIATPVSIGHVGATCVPPEDDKTPLYDDVRAQDYTLVLDGDLRVRNWPSLAVDRSGSPDPDAADFNPRHGRVYVAVSDGDRATSQLVSDPTADESDVRLLYSDTRGVTWQGRDADLRPRRAVTEHVNDQFHPVVAVDDAGTVAIAYYDRTRSLTNTDIDLTLATSGDGGLTFTAQTVTGAPFPSPVHHNPFLASRMLPANPQPQPVDFVATASLLPPIRGGWGNGCNAIGEYNGLVSTTPGEFVLLWGDNRGAMLPPDDAPPGGAGPLSDLDVYAARVAVD